jgi:hypothetical protein
MQDGSQAAANSNAAQHSKKLGRPAGDAVKRYEPYHCSWYAVDAHAPVSTACSNTNTGLVWVKCACKTHFRVMQQGSAQKSVRRRDASVRGGGKVLPPSCEWCTICHMPRAPAQFVSDCAAQCYSLLKHKYANLILVQDYRPPGLTSMGVRSALDIWVPKERLGIMIDGAQHFPGSGRYTTGQAVSDAAWDKAVLAAAGSTEIKGLLRLHHADSKGGGATYDVFIARALQLCRATSVACFTLYTRAYDCKSVVVQAHGPTVYGVASAPTP